MFLTNFLMVFPPLQLLLGNQNIVWNPIHQGYTAAQNILHSILVVVQLRGRIRDHEIHLQVGN